MNYKPHNPTCYVVAWESDRIIKAGYTAAQRWRKFVARGADVVLLADFPVSRPAFALESELFEYMRGSMTYAFETLAESRPYLGSDGGGYAECFRVSDSLPDAIAQCVRIANAFTVRNAKALCTNERDERTYLDPPST
jgi:hypothetical protein